MVIWHTQQSLTLQLHGNAVVHNNTAAEVAKTYFPQCLARGLLFYCPYKALVTACTVHHSTFIKKKDSCRLNLKVSFYYILCFMIDSL